LLEKTRIFGYDGKKKSGMNFFLDIIPFGIYFVLCKKKFNFIFCFFEEK